MKSPDPGVRTGVGIEQVHADWFQVGLIPGVDRAQHAGERPHRGLGLAEHVGPYTPEPEVAPTLQPRDVTIGQLLAVLGNLVELLSSHAAAGRDRTAAVESESGYRSHPRSH